MTVPNTEMDPFSQIYQTLWALAEGSALLTSLVRPANRLKYNDKSWSSPVKYEVSDADLPELALMVTQLNGKLRATSSSSMALLTFDWWLSTGDPSVVRNVLPVMFAVFAAMTPWPDTAQDGSIQWKGKNFIKRVDMTNASFGLADPEKNRGIAGWSCVWSTEVETWYATSDLILAATQKAT